MFKKLKGKLEEVAQAPRLAQYSPFRVTKPETEDESSNKEDCNNSDQPPLIDLGEPSSSTNDQSVALPSSLDQFTLNDEESSNIDASSPLKSGSFQAVDLSEATTSTPNPLRSRTSSELSLQGESSLLPTYIPSPHLFHPQSDLESASEYEDVSPNLDGVSKAAIYQSFQKTRVRYHKYKTKCNEIIKAYRIQETEIEKIKNVLSEHQDKALRRISELREETQLEKQAKADLEDNFRLMLDEKDEFIRVLQTQIHLLKDGGALDSFRNADSSSSNISINDNKSAAGDSTPDVNFPSDYDALKEKNKRLETLLTKCKETIKGNKERVTQLMKEKSEMQQKLEELEKKLETKVDGREESEKLKTDNNDELSVLKLQIENASITLAETKQNFHEELMTKDQEIQRLRSELQQVGEENNNLKITVEENKSKLAAAAAEAESRADEANQRLNQLTTVLEEEKQSLMQDLSRSKAAAVTLLKEDFEKQLAALEEEKTVSLITVQQTWEDKLKNCQDEATQKYEELISIKDQEMVAAISAKDEELKRLLNEKEETLRSAIEEESLQKSSERDNRTVETMEKIERLEAEKNELQEAIKKCKLDMAAESEKFIAKLNEVNQKNSEELQKIKDEAQSEIDKLKSREDDLMKNNELLASDLKSQLEELRRVNESLEEEVQKAENKMKVETSECQKLLDAAALEKEEINRNAETKFNDARRQYEIENNTLTEKIVALEETIRNNLEEEKANNEKIRFLSDEIENLKMNLSTIENEKTNLLAKFEEQSAAAVSSGMLEQTVEELKQKRTDLESQIVSAVAERDDLQARLNEFEVSIDTAYNAVQTLRSKLLQTEGLGSKFSHQYNRKGKSYLYVAGIIFSASEEMIRILQAEVENLQQQMQGKISDVEELDNRLKKVQQYARDQLEKYRLREEENKLHIRQLSEELQVTKEQVTNATLELQKNQFICNNIVVENERLRQEQEDYFRELEECKSDLEKKEEALNNSVSQCLALEDSLNAACERENVEAEFKSKDEELKRAQEEIQTFGMLVQKLEKEVSAKDEQLHQLTQLRDEQHQMMESLQQSSTEAEKNWIHKLEDQKQESEVTIESVREEYESKIEAIHRRTSQDLVSVYDRERLLQCELDNLRHQHEIDGHEVLVELQKLNDLKKCLEDVVSEREITIAELWKKNELTEPVLFEIASDVLSVPVEELNSDVKVLSKQVKEKLNSVKVEQDELLKEKQELEVRLSRYSEDLKNYECKIKECKEVHTKQMLGMKNATMVVTTMLKKEICSLHEKIIEQKLEFEAFKDALQSTSEQCILNLRLKLNIEQESIQKSEDCLASVQNELLMKENILVKVTQDLKNSQLRQEELEKSLTALNESISNVNAQLECEREKHEDLLRVENERWMRELSTTAQKIRDELQPEIEIYKEKVKNLLCEQEELRDQLSSANERVKCLEISNEEIVADSNKSLENLQSGHIEKCKFLESEKNDLIQETSLLKNELENCKSKVEELEKQSMRHKEEEHLLKQAKDEFKNEIQKKEETIKEFSEKIKEGESNLASQASVHSSLTEELLLLRSQLEESVRKNNADASNFNQTIEELKKQNAEELVNVQGKYKEQLQTRGQEIKKKAEVKLAQIQKKLQTSNEKALADHKSELSQLQEQMSALQSAHRLEIEEIERRKQSAVQELEKTLAEARNELERIQESGNQQLQVQQDNHDLIVQELQTRIGVLEEQLTKSELDFKVELESAKTLNETLQQEIENCKLTITELEKTNSDEHRSKAEVAKKISDLEGILTGFEKKKDEFSESLQARLTRVTEECRLEKELLEKELAKKDAQIDESLIVAQENTMERERAMERMKLETQKLAQKLKKREEQVQQLKAQLTLQNSNKQTESPANFMSQENKDPMSGFNSKEELRKLREPLENELILLREQKDEAERKLCELQQTLSESGLPQELAKSLQDEKAQIQKEYQTRLQETLLDLREKENTLDNLTEITEEKLQIKNKEMEEKIREYEQRISTVRKDHTQKIQELENRYKTQLNRRLDEQSEKFEEEIKGFTKEWNRERKLHVEDLKSNARSQNQELEEQSRLTIAAMESSSTSNELLRQQIITQTKEIDQLKSRHQNEMSDLKHLLESTAVQLKRANVAQSPLLTEPTEMEYLRNILYEYMMGRETTTLAKVIAAVVKFTDVQTQKVLEREESRHNPLAQILRT